MGYRTGRFQYEYDPDEVIPMPRPWMEIDGDRAKNRKPLYPRGAARPTKPTFTDPNKAFIEGGGQVKVDASFLKKFPAKLGTKQVYPGVGGYFSKGIYFKTNKEARYYTMDAKAKKGVYIRYVERIGYNPLTGQTYPVFKYVRVPDSYLEIMNNPIAYLDSPKALLRVAQFLWKYGANRTYKAFVAAVKTAIQRRNEQLTDYRRQWLEQEYARQQAILNEWKSKAGFWDVS